ncbi:zinc ribbon domain-containing protein [Marinilabilia salmonicolor]|uniref:zinc ribbon domain-containing protein n=1 Tax=Marinilabilia salmonicolor TaxID=989 RepID=UPI00029A351C|nr:zinc ribbon domain-containing protein [Marinilabilia salmonicolor]
MKTIPIISAIIVIIGCFMPWIQLGALFTNRGIDNPDGALMLILGVIAGSLAIFNYSKDKSRNKWIYFMTGIIGLIIAILDLQEVNSRAKEIAESLGQFNAFFGSNTDIPLFNFVGSGLYIVSLGSFGLFLCGIGIIKLDSKKSNEKGPLHYGVEVDNNTKVCPQCAETIKKEAKICRFCHYKFSDEELQIVSNDISVSLMEKEKKELLNLHQMIDSEKNKMFGGKMTDEIENCINDLFVNQEKAVQLLNEYIELNQTDLIDELKKINSSYNAIKRNLSIFIDLGIVEENYPHSRKE